MRLPYFIAQKIHWGQDATRQVSKPAVRIATVSIAIGIAVMLITVCVIIGFKQEVSRKVVGFGSHVQVVNFDNNNTYEMQAIKVPDSVWNIISGVKGVRSVQKFATKPGIIKSESEVQGIILKGVDTSFDWDFFGHNLVEGVLPNYTDEKVSNDILISQYLANLLHVKVGDRFYTYFIQDKVRARRFTVCGIYNTDFVDYDKMFLIGDMRHVQHLNGWTREQFSGLEVLVHNFEETNRIAEDIYFATANRFDEEGNSYFVQTIQELNPKIFAWLDLLDMNVVVIIVLMLAVAGFNIISGLLILILESTSLIGTLKALGGNNWLIRKVFLWQATFLIVKGMLWGNTIGLTLCALQHYLHFIPLDAATYYVSSVPVAFSWAHILALNVGTVLTSVLMLVGPSYIISKISPAKVMRYE